MVRSRTRLTPRWPGFKSIPAISGLTLFLVLYLAPRAFSPGAGVFPSHKKQHFQISIRPGMIDEESLRGCASESATPKSLACENIRFSSLFARRARRNGCFRRLLNRYLFIYLFIKLTKFGLIKTSPVLAGASFHPKTRKVLNRKSNSSCIKYWSMFTPFLRVDQECWA